MKLKKTLKSLLLATSCLIAMPTMSSCLFFGTDEGTLIKEISTTVQENGDTLVEITFMDEEKAPVTFTIPKGETGENGQNGNGIEAVTQKLSDDGSSLILTFTFTDGSEPKIIEVPVINGKDGVSIKNIATEIDENGNTIVTVSFEGELDDVSFTIPKGEKGDRGNGIASIDVVDNEDGSRVITLTYTDPSYDATKLTIPAPVKGETGNGISYIVSSETDTNYVITFYFTDGTNQELSFTKPEQPSTWLSGMTNPSASEGNNGDFYLDKSSMTIYQKTNGRWGLIATLSQDYVTHTVTFNANGGVFTSGFSTSYVVNHGETFYGNPNYTIPRVTKEGYDFIGWHTLTNQDDVTSGMFTDLTPINCDMTLYAWWKETI